MNYTINVPHLEIWHLILGYIVSSYILYGIYLRFRLKTLYKQEPEKDHENVGCFFWLISPLSLLIFPTTLFIFIFAVRTYCFFIGNPQKKS